MRYNNITWQSHWEKVSLGCFENKEEYFELLEKSDLELQQYLGKAGKFIPVREVLEEYYKKYVRIKK